MRIGITGAGGQLATDLVALCGARGDAVVGWIRDLLAAMIKAYEIQGVIALENAFNRVGLDHVLLVRVASTAVATQMLGGTREQITAGTTRRLAELAAVATDDPVTIPLESAAGRVAGTIIAGIVTPGSAPAKPINAEKPGIELLHVK